MVGELTTWSGTHAGTLLGTVAYMSPEQAAGRSADFLSDQFALGTMLYELASGRHPFRRDTTAQTLAAIIDDEPEPLSVVDPKLPLPFRWIVERCLAKAPGDRYGSTDDLALDLARVRDHLSDLSGAAPVRAPNAAWPRWAAAAVVLLLMTAGAWAIGRRAMPAVSPPPDWTPITFRPGFVHTARFAGDGQTVVYTAALEGRPMEVYSTTLRARSRARLSCLPRACWASHVPAKSR